MNEFFIQVTFINTINSNRNNTKTLHKFGYEKKRCYIVNLNYTKC